MSCYFSQKIIVKYWLILQKVHHKPPESRVKSQKPHAANVLYIYVLFYLTGDKTRRVIHSIIEVVDVRAEVHPADYHPLAAHQQKLSYVIRSNISVIPLLMVVMLISFSI